MQVKKQQLEPDIVQLTGSKLGKEYFKAEHCHLAYLTCMQNTSSEMPGRMKHKMDSRLQGKLSLTSDMQVTPLLGRRQRGAKEPIDESEKGERKADLKHNIQKLRSWHLVPALHCK